VSSRSAAVTPRDRPGAPRIGTPTAGNAAVLVRWAQPLSNGGVPVTAYVVRTYRNGTQVLSTTVGATATSLLQRGLRNGTAYTFTVTAKNAVGWGAESRAVTSVPRR
jgi:Fibronectin type III domain